MQENINIPDSNITANLTFRNLVLMNMQQLTNFPYIEKDFDALTDYELLCLVVKYLNDVITNSNEQNDSITNLYNSFLALQTYVNNTKDTLEDAFNDLDNYVTNYFANLDVQEEINNKLDDMAESGQLTDIIAQYLGLAGMIAFDTVADMKLAQNLVNGSKCHTLGFHSVNDGGGAVYKIRQITNDDVVDEMTIIEVYDNYLVAELIINEVIYAEQLGAYGDGTHDDTLVLQKCIDVANSKLYKIEMNKEYLITDTLELYNNITLNINKLTYTGNNEALVLDSISYVNLNINELNTSKNGISLIATTDICHNNNINVNALYGEYNGIQLISQYGIAYNKITFSLISCNNYGIYVFSDRDTYASSYIGENSIYGGRISKGVWGIYANGTGSHLAIPTLKVYNVALESPTNGIYFNNVECGLIDYPRYGEMGSSKIVISLNGDCKNTVFNGIAPLYTANIDNHITYPTHKRNPIMLNCPILKANGNTIGKAAQIYSSGISIIPITHYRMKTVGNETYTAPLDEFQFESFTISNNATINLNQSYGAHNIDSFIVTISSDVSLVMYDANNTKIFDNTGATSGSYTKYKFYCEDNNGTDKWVYIQFPYTSV